MKKIVQNYFVVGTLVAVCAGFMILFGGCATTPTQSPAQIAATAIRALVPAAVQYAAVEDTNSIPYFKATALALETAVSSGQYDPVKIKAALDAVNAKELHSPMAQAAVMAGFGLYQGFFAATVVSDADAVMVITAIPQSIRGWSSP